MSDRVQINGNERNCQDNFPVLISVCLQNDFISSDYDGVNPLLYIGQDESVRLIGTDPKTGPMSQFFTWIRSIDTSSVEVIHVKSNHNFKSKVVQQFGLHALDGTYGEKMILNLEGSLNKNENIIKTDSVNVFHNTGLSDLIINTCKKQGKKIRCGIIGVWTDATIQFLCYELSTRYSDYIAEICVCPSLSAGRSRNQHYNAIAQLTNVLGVRTIDSILDFQSWLNQCELKHSTLVDQLFNTGIEYTSDIPLEDHHLKILCFLYKNSKNLVLKKMSGGFSGSKVFLISSKDNYGHEQAKTILKIGDRTKITRERVNFEKVEDMLVNNAPKIMGYLELEKWGGLKFSFASMGGSPNTFRSLYKTLPQDKIDSILYVTFEEILFKLYKPTTRENKDLFAEYDFDGKGWAYFAGGSDTPSVVKKEVQDLLQIENGDEENLDFLGIWKVKNVVNFLENVKNSQYHSLCRRGHHVSLIHGDLNGGNILVDAHDNVWLIDFEYTQLGPTLKDVTKVEHDILYEYTAFETQEDMKQGLSIVQTLVNVIDLGVDLPNLPDLKNEKILKAWNTIKTLRKIVAKIVGFARHPLQILVPLLRYALFSMALPVCSQNQKVLCLAAACGYADKIQQYIMHTNLQVYWIPQLGKGQIGQTILAGRKDWKRNLDADIADLLKESVSKVICLLPLQEIEKFGDRKFVEKMERKFKFIMVPLVHCKPPQTDELEKLFTEIQKSMDLDEKVVIMSIAGLGRPSTLIASYLVDRMGLLPSEAIKLVRQIRGGRAFETDSQVNFVLSRNPNHESIENVLKK